MELVHDGIPKVEAGGVSNVGVCVGGFENRQWDWLG